MVRLPFGPSTSILAPSAAMATFMSDGLVAMQVSPLDGPLSVWPRIAWIRLYPLIAAHPEPGSRLLQAGKLISVK